MAKVAAVISVSLDGFVTGPHNSPDNPMGDRGDRVHDWMFQLASWRAQHGEDGGETSPSDVFVTSFNEAGAYVMGRQMFDEGERPWGANPPFHAPVFVVTHRRRAVVTAEGGTSYTFVTDGIESAVWQAKAAAGGKDVTVAGGADVIRQCLAAGLVDELVVHVTPVLLGAGTRLFDGVEDARIRLEQLQAVEGAGVAHLRYRPVSEAA